MDQSYAAKKLDSLKLHNCMLSVDSSLAANQEFAQPNKRQKLTQVVALPAACDSDTND